MLELEVRWFAARARRWPLRPRASWTDVAIGGDVAGLQSLADGVIEACESGRAHIDAYNQTGSVQLTIERGFGDLRALPLTPGVLLYGDAESLTAIVDSVRVCVANAESASPLRGYHDHIDLYEQDCGTDQIIGGIIVVSNLGTRFD